jgi:hypothetical protein
MKRATRPGTMLVTMFATCMGLGHGLACARPATPAIEASQPAAASQAAVPASLTQPERNAQTQGGQMADSTKIFVNQKEASREQLEELKRMYGMAPPAGRYWYDSRSGLYGAWGFEAAGYIRPGHIFAPLPADASRGNTGVFINGRQINLVEAMFYKQIFGAVYPGRWWLDGNTGNLGMEGNPLPMANIVVALQQAQRSGSQGGGHRWRDDINKFSGGAENGCVWVNIPGGSYTGSGC